MTAQTAIMNSIAADRRQLAGDALIASDCKDIITEAFERCAALLKDAGSNRAHEILAHLESAEGEAGAMQLESE